MDRGRKRKADQDDTPSSASKRQKIPNQNTQSIAHAVQPLIDLLKDAKDRSGRSIIDLFLTLPSKRELPEYYDTIKLPIAIDTIEKKLHRNDYPDISSVESDLRRMVSNAKQFNDEKSQVFADAERLRKMVINWMKANNPAYEDPTYTTQPTPIPDQLDNGNGSILPEFAPKSEKPRKPTITLSAGRKPSRSQPAETSPKAPTPEPLSEDGDDFSGKTLGQAQEAIVQELIDHTEDEIQVFEPFRNLPPRTLTDYYKLIKKPTSLNGIKKRVQGRHGRDAATGVTDFKTWDAFEDEVSNIWKNAREYNEDGSDMYDLAGEFEEYFRQRLAIARAKVEEPQGPRIKLNARPRPTIHLGAKNSPAPAQVSTPTSEANDASTAAQTKVEQVTTNGARDSQPPQAPARSSSQVPNGINGAQNAKAQSPPAVKTETTGQTPSLQAAPPASTRPDAQASPKRNTTMPPPPRLLSGSPHPAAQPAIQPVVNTMPAYIPAPPTFLDNFSRTRPVSEALLPNVSVTTHPQLNLRKPFRLTIPASRDFTHQSTTIMLPSAQYYLQIIPTVSPQLVSGRQHKIFVTVNGTRLHASTKPLTNGDAIAIDTRTVYDAALNPGVNRIEVEIAAAMGRGATVETEKVSVFANLMRG